MSREQVEGYKFGFWTVQFRLKCPFVECICDCGTRKSVSLTSLRAGLSRSCGCQTGAMISSSKIRHGGCRRSGETGAHSSWRNMWERCTRKSHPFYHNYGGRGVTICERWNTFDNFLADMGDRPQKLTLERKNGDLGYSPDNCKWATRREQNLNRRNYTHTKKRVYKNK